MYMVAPAEMIIQKDCSMTTHSSDPPCDDIYPQEDKKFNSSDLSIQIDLEDLDDQGVSHDFYPIDDTYYHNDYQSRR